MIYLESMPLRSPLRRGFSSRLWGLPLVVRTFFLQTENDRGELWINNDRSALG